MSDGLKEALRAKSILRDRLSVYRWKLRLIRRTCRDMLDDCAGWDLEESGPVALETLEHIRDHLAKEPT